MRELLMAVCDKPACDTRRGVLADWCEEHGNEKFAQFIRLQLLLSKTPVMLKANKLCHQIEWDAMDKTNKRFELTSPKDRIGVLHYMERNPEIAPLLHRERELWEDVRPMFEGYGILPSIEPGVSHKQVRLGEVTFESKMIIERGFPKYVHSRFLEWVGGTCDRCAGIGIHENQKCIACGGMGRIRSVGLLTEKWPIEKVLTEKRPHYDNESGLYEFGRGNSFPSELPEQILAIMRKQTGQTSGHLFFYTELDGVTALSNALLKWRKDVPRLSPSKALR